ncbi:MAG: hypothetical protein KGH85_08060, partial [Thaumarchaeota archaeon]|nr:hypothetical protein [Nitrososphaerota archaeon]
MEDAVLDISLNATVSDGLSNLPALDIAESDSARVSDAVIGLNWLLDELAESLNATVSDGLSNLPALDIAESDSARV